MHEHLKGQFGLLVNGEEGSVLASLEIMVDYKNDKLEIHAPKHIRVVHRCTNDSEDGVTVIFERRRPGVL